MITLTLLLALASPHLGLGLLALVLGTLALGLFTHTITSTYKQGNLTTSNTTETCTGDSEDNIDISVPASTTLAVDSDIVVAKIQSMILLATGGALTVRTNSSGSPIDSIALVAGVPLIWTPTHRDTCPFTVNVTHLYLVNAGGAAVTFTMRMLLSYQG